MRGGEKYEREGIRKKASKKEKWCRRFYLGPHKPMVTLPPLAPECKLKREELVFYQFIVQLV